MTDQTVQDVLQESDDRALLWKNAKAQWRPIYEASHPLPLSHRIGLGKFGVEIVATLVVVLASLVLAAMRTGFQFFLMALATSERYLSTGVIGTVIENNTAIVFALVEMIAAVLCIEGSLLVAGLIRGRKTGSTSLSKRQVIVAGAISMICSLGQSFGIMPQLGLSNAFDLAIAGVTGLGSSLIVFFGAEAFGAIVYNTEVANARANEIYQKALLTWYHEFDQSFETEGRRRLFKVKRAPQPVQIQQEPARVVEFPTGKTDAIRQWLIANEMLPVEVGPSGKISYKDLSALVGIPDNEVRPLVDRLEKRGDGWK